MSKTHQGDIQLKKKSVHIDQKVERFNFDDFSYVVAVALECIWVKKPGEETSIESDLEMSRVFKRFCN